MSNVYDSDMAHIELDPQWEAFVQSQLESGRYHSAGDVIQDGLRTLEARQSKLRALREHLAMGEAQAERGEFVDQTMDEMLSEFKAEMNDT